MPQAGKQTSRHVEGERHRDTHMSRSAQTCISKVPNPLYSAKHTAVFAGCVSIKTAREDRGHKGQVATLALHRDCTVAQHESKAAKVHDMSTARMTLQALRWPCCPVLALPTWHRRGKPIPPLEGNKVRPEYNLRTSLSAAGLCGI